jgi:periplasmic divalent cation tolerance protein
MPKDRVLLVYVTAASQDEARQIGRTLVEERLAACVNILTDHTAIYRWDDHIQENSETAFIAKTTKARFKAMAARIKQLHSYATPAIVALKADGDAVFLDWVRTETTPR